MLGPSKRRRISKQGTRFVSCALAELALIRFPQLLSITGGDFVWLKDAGQPTLEDINLTLRKGELLGVLGRVGAGKVCPLTAITFLVLNS